MEDNPDTVRLMSRLLKMMGHQVTAASSIAEGLEQAAKVNGAFDLVLSDLGLPDGSGLELMRQLHKRWNLKGIAITGYGMENDMTASQEAGFVSHLTKPVQASVLQDTIQSVLAPNP